MQNNFLQDNLLIQKYIANHSDLPFLYSERERFAHQHEHMICGNEVGNFLVQLVRTYQAKHILEIGTMIGFSTICMAKHLPENGYIQTIELRPEDAQRAAENFLFFGVHKKIKLHVGNALTILPQLNSTWDIVFIDADKVNYKNYYELVFPFVRKNGSIIFDNMLFHGQVLTEKPNNKNAIALQEMNLILQKDERVHNMLLPIRDGIQWVIKK